MKTFLIVSLLVCTALAQECTKSIDCGRGTSWICAHGKCIELKPLQRTFYGMIPCPETDASGDCVDPRPLTRHFSLPCTAPCLPGQRCNNGVCESIPNLSRRFSNQDLCSTNADCTPPAVCGDGVCEVDNGFGGKCSTGTQCPDGYDCVDAKCAKPSRRHFGPCPIACPPGQGCRNGVCLPFPNFY